MVVVTRDAPGMVVGRRGPQFHPGASRMSAFLGMSLTLALIGQAPAAVGEDFAAGSEARLAYMKESVRVYDIRPADDTEIRYRLQAEPVLRFTNPVGRSRDGTVFLWLDGDGRP